jgi:glycosyltransferase involved in cell wall biosynthesis
MKHSEETKKRISEALKTKPRSTRPKLSVAIPTSDMKNKEYFLETCLDSLWNQKFQNFEIVVTDNSDDDTLKEICEYYGGIKYFKNPNKGMAQNTNEAIKRSTGELIKILYMDDHLRNEQALQSIVEAFRDHWLITAADNNPHPRYTMDIETGNNKLGSPSALTIRNVDPLLFDENLTWLLDCDYYKRMYLKYGPPTVLNKVGVVIGVGPHQATYNITDERKQWEVEYLKKKYG